MSTERSFESDPSSASGSLDAPGGELDAPNYPISAQVPVTDAATLVAGQRPSRGAVTVKNIAETNSVFIGNEGVTDTNGFPLKPDEGLTLSSSNRVYAICASGQEAEVAVLEDA